MIISQQGNTDSSVRNREVNSISTHLLSDIPKLKLITQASGFLYRLGNLYDPSLMSPRMLFIVTVVNILCKILSGFRFSQWFIVDIDSALGSLYHMDVGMLSDQL
jgi:hypothetical protein